MSVAWGFAGRGSGSTDRVSKDAPVLYIRETEAVSE